MTSLDPLLHHLHRRGTGSWSYFARSVENFDSDLNPWMCARALAEHALVEFDYNGTCDWSVTPLQIVASDFGTAIMWGATGRHLPTDELKVEIQARTAWVGRRPCTYRHGIHVHKQGIWPPGMQPIPAAEIRRMLPSIDAMVGVRPLGRIPARKAERLVVRPEERRNPDGGFRRTLLVADWEPREPVAVDRYGIWRLDHHHYVMTRNYRIFDLHAEEALWRGFVDAAASLGSDRLAIGERQDLHIVRYPALPVPYVRAMLLSGAREVASDWSERRKFTNVTPVLLQWLSDRLGFTITNVS